MFCTKHSIRRINSIHERCLRLIQQTYTSDFEVLLENLNEKPLHQKCIELLMTEVYKYLNGLSLEIMSESQNPSAQKFGLDSIAYRASQL